MFYTYSVWIQSNKDNQGCTQKKMPYCYLWEQRVFLRKQKSTHSIGYHVLSASEFRCQNTREEEYIHSFSDFSIGPIYVLYLAFFKSRYNNCNNDQREKKSATCIITTNWFFLDLQGLQGVLNKGELKYVFLYLSYLHDNFCLIFGPYFSYSK